MALATVIQVGVGNGATATITHGLTHNGASQTPDLVFLTRIISAAMTEVIGVSRGNSVACYLFGGATTHTVDVTIKAFHSIEDGF